jgi:CopG family transcriptional regulator, nickel-responsive regulator
MSREKTIRFGVSIPSRLLRQFDRLVEEKKFGNRSEAIRDLIRQFLVEEEWESDEETIGTVTLVFNHHVGDLSEELNSIQHEMVDAIVSSLHVHLDHHLCLEVIVVRGKSSRIRKLADRLIGTRGVVHGKLTAATVGRSF